jgi:hypothetical protein
MDFLPVHGSTRSPRGYDRLAAALRQRGHLSVAADLPRDRPEWTAERYAAVASAQAAELIEPVLVVHSAAGALAPAIAAADRGPHADPGLDAPRREGAAGQRRGRGPGGHCPHGSRPEQMAALPDR